jgi:protein-tyrosine phosphatase
LHCHPLPAWDDGPGTLEGSLQLLQAASDAGVEVLVATPHVGRAFRGVEHPAGEIPAAVERLQSAANEAGLKIKLVPGAEIMLGAVDLLARPGVDAAWTYGGLGKHMLVESPYPAWPDFGDNLIYELGLRGVTAIIAHPERYVDVQRDPTKMIEAGRQGHLLQVTARALLGMAGKTQLHCALALLEAGAVHFVSSDAHSEKHPYTGAVFALLCRHVGERRARQICRDNPRAVIEGRPLGRQVEPRTRAPGFWERITRKRRR